MYIWQGIVHKQMNRNRYLSVKRPIIKPRKRFYELIQPAVSYIMASQAVLTSKRILSPKRGYGVLKILSSYVTLLHWLTL